MAAVDEDGYSQQPDLSNEFARGYACDDNDSDEDLRQKRLVFKIRKNETPVKANVKPVLLMPAIPPTESNRKRTLRKAASDPQQIDSASTKSDSLPATSDIETSKAQSTDTQQPQAKSPNVPPASERRSELEAQLVLAKTQLANSQSEGLELRLALRKVMGQLDDVQMQLEEEEMYSRERDDKRSKELVETKEDLLKATARNAELISEVRALEQALVMAKIQVAELQAESSSRHPPRAPASVQTLPPTQQAPPSTHAPTTTTTTKQPHKPPPPAKKPDSHSAKSGAAK